jgi:hypothetical protein
MAAHLKCTTRLRRHRCGQRWWLCRSWYQPDDCNAAGLRVLRGLWLVIGLFWKLRSHNGNLRFCFCHWDGLNATMAIVRICGERSDNNFTKGGNLVIKNRHSRSVGAVESQTHLLLLHVIIADPPISE